MRRAGMVAACWLLLLALAGCGAARPAPRDGRALDVVATTTQVQDFVRVVGGDRVRLTGILKPGLDPHDYEPSPADLTAIAHADVLVVNGVGLEGWLDDTIRSAGFKGLLVDTSRGVRLRTGEGGEHDPHIWQSPPNAKVMVANVEQGLERAAPASAAVFRANRAAYDAKLDALDASIARQLGSLANKRLVTNHDAFGYYIDRYGLQFEGAVIPSFDTSAELSARQVQDLVARIKATGVRAVFSESTLPPKTAEAIASEAGVRVVEGSDALYGDSLGPPGSDGDTYLKMEAHNTRIIVAALSGT